MLTASDPKRVRAFGRGLQPHGVRVQDEAKFKIVTDGAGEGVPEVNIIGPGKDVLTILAHLYMSRHI